MAEEPGVPQSMRSERMRHGLVTEQQQRLGLWLQVPQCVCPGSLSSLWFGQITVAVSVRDEDPAKILVSSSTVPMAWPLLTAGDTGAVVFRAQLTTLARITQGQLIRRKRR